MNKIKENVDFSFVTDAVKHLYAPDKGRPSFPPETLFRILFLEVWANLSDVQVCDDSDLRKDLSEKGIRSYVPNRAKKDRLQQQGFTYNRKSTTVQCRQGKKAIGSIQHQQGGLTFYFSEKDCQRCPRKDSCLTKSETRKRVYVKPEVFEKSASRHKAGNAGAKDD